MDADRINSGSSVGAAPRGAAIVRKALTRRRVNAFLDDLRFRIDSFPRHRTVFAEASYVAYHPLPWVGRPGGRRAEGTYSRWQAIEPILDQLDPQSAVDLGANAGFFALNLAQRGIPTVALDGDPTFVRTVSHVAHKAQIKDLGTLQMWLNPQTVVLVPEVDVVIFLSVWHHLVRAFGLDSATQMLRMIWKRTRRALFFDTGQTEMPASFGLPAMEPSAELWLSDYLSRTCANGDVRNLGEHGGFYDTKRTLFAVLRSGAQPG